MKLLQRIVWIFAGISILTACSLPGAPVNQGPSVSDRAATIVAATMQAAVPSAMALITPFASPVVVVAATPTGKPTLYININDTTCRSGPGGDFKVIATFPSGTTVDLIGKDSPDNYWVVTDPASHELCWVQVQNATPGGSFDTVPEMTPQAPSGTVPTRPGNMSWNFFCDNTTLTVSISWTDTSNNENGFRVFRKESQVADVGPNVTTYTETIPYTLGVTENYSVIAYNDAGPSESRSTPSFSCQ